MSSACRPGESSSPNAAWIPPWAFDEFEDCSDPFAATATRAPAREASHHADEPYALAHEAAPPGEERVAAKRGAGLAGGCGHADLLSGAEASVVVIAQAFAERQQLIGVQGIGQHAGRPKIAA